MLARCRIGIHKRRGRYLTNSLCYPTLIVFHMNLGTCRQGNTGLLITTAGTRTPALFLCRWRRKERIDTKICTYYPDAKLRLGPLFCSVWVYFIRATLLFNPFQSYLDYTTFYPISYLSSILSLINLLSSA